MEVRTTFIIGRLYARDVRRALREYGLEFTEERGWLDSQFVVTGPRSKIVSFVRALRAWRNAANA